MPKAEIRSITVSVDATLTIDEHEAYVLSHITSYEYLREFHAKNSRAIPIDEMVATMRKLRVVCDQIIQAKVAAVDSLKPKKPKGEPA